MHLSRMLTLKLLKRQEWDRRRAPQPPISRNRSKTRKRPATVVAAGAVGLAAD